MNAAVQSLILGLLAVVLVLPVYASEQENSGSLHVEFVKGPLNDIIFEDKDWEDVYLFLESRKPVYIDPQTQFDIPLPPANDSETTAQELRLLLQYAQEKRTPEQVKRIKEEQAGLFREMKLGMGKFITGQTQEKLNVLEKISMEELDHFLYKLKRKYKRARPTQLAKNLTLVIPVPGSGAYPSGHSGVAQLNAMMYSYIDPAHDSEYKKLSMDVSKRRMIAGIHYPSDCDAGRALADQVFEKLLTFPEYRTLIDDVKSLFEAGLQSPTLTFTDEMWSRDGLQAASNKPFFLSEDEMFNLAAPPANDSPQTMQDLETLRQFAKERRSKDQVSLINAEAHEWKQLSLHPDTKVSQEIRAEIDALATKAVVDEGYFSFQKKRLFKRPRPNMLDAQIVPIIAVPGHPSYPSGHAGQSHIAALVYSAIDPAHKDFYMNLARDIGVRREIAGLHYPSDTRAGVFLASQVFERLMTIKEFRSEIDRLAKTVQKFQ